MNKILIISIIFFGLMMPAIFVFAVTSGYAWSDNIGWINFGCDNCNVQITDTSVTGYVWSENYGWINLSPSTSGVSNTIFGKLSGYAWGENTGWIDFGGANINCAKKIVGQATGDIVGTIDFDCANCGVTTSWQRINCGGGAPITVVACYSNFDCGADGYLEPAFCKVGDNNVYRKYTTYICSDPGLGSSSCSSSTEDRLIETCSGEKVCYNGSCQNVACFSDSDCGTDGFFMFPFCQNGDVYQNYTTYTCSNPGAGNSSCFSSEEAKLIKNCSDQEVCYNEDCVLQQHNKCSNSKCMIVPGSGVNQCLSDNDCQIPKHNQCNDRQQCVSVEGEGLDQCQIDSNCQVPKHTECENEQCVVVMGTGQNQCMTNTDCVLRPANGGTVCANGVCESQEDCFSCPQDCGECATVETIINIVQNKVKEVTEPVAENVKTAAKEVKKIVNTPEGSVATKTISTIGVATGAVAVSSVVVFAPTSIFELLLMPARLFGLLLAAFGLKKKKLPWGVIYDSVTKQPIDPAYVVLKDENGREVATEVTDIDGRYGFFVKPGTYYITATKTNYLFPSQKLSDKTNDEIYENIYLGEKIEIFEEGEVIAKNIPMDPLKFDWNEFAKKNKSFMKFYSHGDIWFRRISDFIFILGFVVAMVALFSAPYPYNLIIFTLYLILWLLRRVGLKLKPLGHIMDKVTGIPLSFAILRIVMPGTDVEIAHRVADKYGRYYCLVPKGKYYLKIEKKNDDGSYSQVYISQVIDTSKGGIIKKDFKI